MQERSFMNNMESEYESALYFAALKLIQQLCADGLISEEMFHEILNENADKVDTSEFLFYRSDRKEIKNDVSV